MPGAIDARPGRFCPVHYRYAPASFGRPPEVQADVLYVVGCLYGDAQALDAVERLAARERGDARIVFRGDFHWFDIDPATFAAADVRVRRQVDYDADAFASAFLAAWAPGSPAHESYWPRIARSPQFTVEQAQTRTLP